MYKIMGADRQEYGPVTSEQVRQWIAEGRANGQTIANFEGSPWKPLSSFPEFADVLRTAVPPPLGQSPYVGAQPYTGAKANTMAVTGLVLSVLGTCCSPLSLIGLILSVIGLSQIQKNPAMYTTGKVVPIIGIVVALLDMILIGVAFSSGAFDQIMRNFPR